MTEREQKIREMLASRDEEMRALGLTLREDEDIKRHLRLDECRSLQMEYPEIAVGGSLGLYLHGVRLERWKKAESDLDLVMPTFIMFKDCENIVEKQKSDTDFDFIIYTKKGVLLDIRIDNKRRYEEIEFEEFTYKVVPLEIIMEAKCRYAIKGIIKHKEDISEICGKKVKETKSDYNFTFTTEEGRYL